MNGRVACLLSFWPIVVAVWLAIFFLFRVTALTQYPPGLFVDESSIGLNASTILTTGADEHGVSYPLYFKAFGDYKNGLFVYSVVPLFKLFGTSIESLRLASALWGLATVGIFAVWVKSQKPRKALFLLCVGILLSNPWLLQLSRVAFEVASYPFFLMLAVFAYWKLVHRNVKLEDRHWSGYLWYVLFSGALLGVFYAYTSGRMLAPLLLLVGFGLQFGKSKLSHLCIGLALFGIGILPAIGWEYANQGALLARYSVVGLSRYTTSTQEFVTTAVRQYAQHFSPAFLLEKGDGNLRHSSSGLFLMATIPLILVGLVSTFKNSAQRFYLWVLSGLLLSPIPSALTIQSPHTLRSSSLVVFALLFAIKGVQELVRGRIGRILLTLCSVGIVLQSIAWLSSYTTMYVRSAEVWFDDGTVQALNYAINQSSRIYVSEKLYPGTYATVKFLTAIRAQKTSATPTITMFNPDREFPIETGLLVLDYQTCQLIPEELLEQFTTVYQNYSACVLQKN
ncbi:hypothetical protein KBD71_01870 [Candidatus Woesebacteria bacterium]|nr:hypothetical protein [Candidatus Woesebacteria bacterium]